MDREAIVTYLEGHRDSLVRAAVLAIAILAILIAFLVRLGFNEARAARQAEAERLARAIPPDELWYLPDPLGMPGIQLSREPRERWSAQERDLWYDTPDAGEIGALREAGRRQIDDLLESVP